MVKDSDLLYEKIISENMEKGQQLRLVLNTFRDVEYIHLRKYFLSFDEGFLPSKEGASMPATISNIYALLDALIEICAMAESSDAITKHFKEKLEKLNEQQSN